MSDIIQTAKGFFLIAKTDTREPVATPLEKLDGTLRRQLTLAKRQEAERVFMKELRAATPVEVYSEALAAVRLPITTAKAEEPPPPSFP